MRRVFLGKKEGNEKCFTEGRRREIRRGFLGKEENEKCFSEERGREMRRSFLGKKKGNEKGFLEKEGGK